MRDYVKAANRYIENVLSGKIPACREVIQACQRQRRDLARKRFPYRFDEQRATRVCRFLELLKHAKGPLAGQNIHLEDWQCFFITTVFGWVDKKTGYRRYTRSYAELPRGTGKSAISSGVSLYMLCADGELGADIYSFATTRQQARIVFDDAKAMARQSKELQQAYGLEVLANSILVPGTNSKFLPRSSEIGSNEGLNSHFACVDELHAHKTRDLYDVVIKSLGKRSQSLFWTITTAGNNIAGICYEVRRTVKKILDGTITDETQFGLIYTIDSDDDWRTEEALRKANPNYGISQNPRDLLSDLRNALVNASAENDYKTKRLDVWCNSQQAWLDMNKYRKCNRDVELSEFAGCHCIYGLDLAAKIDIAALVRLFWRVEKDKKVHFYVFPQFFLPSETLHSSSNSQYIGWEKQGLISTFDGPIIDLTGIQNYLLADMAQYDVLAVAYDPWQATQLSQNMMAEGAPMVEISATVKNFSEPMKKIQALIYAKRLHSDGNPVLEWMASNVVCRLDAKDNIYPRKERPEDKIDGMVALIMAMQQAVFLNVETDYIENNSTDIDWSLFKIDL